TATAVEPAPAPTPVSAPSSSKDDGLLDLANVALGVAEKPVDRDGETFRVDRGWFTRSLEELVRGKTPTLASNRNGGVRLRGIRPKSFLGVLGLRSNDVVMAINGALVNTPAGISRELTDAAGPELRVKVSRKQQETTYTYSWK
ncbi:MAG: S1C family serine protease, partial [Myxococcota bacterium]